MLIMVDGFISTAAYLAAERICPLVREYAFFSHMSAEQGQQHIVRATDKKPLLSLLRGVCHIFNDMATFSGGGVSKAE